MRPVKDGDLEKNVESRSVVREATEELTLRAEEAGAWCTFIDTKACWTQKHVGHKKLKATTRGTPSARLFSKGVEGAEWKTMCFNYKELHKAVKKQEILRPQEGQGAFCL